jgi:hypothetical protein
VALPQAMEGGREQEISHHDGHHEGDAHDPGEAQPIGLSGIPEHGIAAVLGGVKREQENDPSEISSREIEIAQGLVPLRPLRDVADHEHRDEVQTDERQRSRAQGNFAHGSSSSQ